MPVGPMRAAFVSGPGELEIREISRPEAAAHSAVVEVALCGVCGSDAAAWKSGRSRAAVFGHEWVGTVVEVGVAVDSVGVGDRVVIAAPPSCGSCRYCRAGLPDECEDVFSVVAGRDAAAPPHGGFATAISVAASRLMRVPDSLPDEAAAMIEPTAVVLHGLLRCPSPVGASVVVQGAGPIGLLAVQGAIAMGATRVIVVEPDARRRELALAVGAELAIEPGGSAAEDILELTATLGADLVVECTGVPALVQVGADWARRGGVLLLLGYPHSPSEVVVGSWMRNQLGVRTGIAYQRRDCEIALALIAQDRIDTAALHSGTVGLDDLDSILRDISAGRSRQVKALVEPSR
jgi:(R,R)-butanediol dehydrogenase/meso-butanediol dehydrogenase/diacetyl reductase